MVRSRTIGCSTGPAELLLTSSRQGYTNVRSNCQIRYSTSTQRRPAYRHGAKTSARSSEVAITRRTNWFDVWFPNLAPSLQTMKQGLAAVTDAQLRAFKKKYRAEMSAPEAARSISLLAALSHSANFSVGCYCEDENRCHRTVLRQLLADCGSQAGLAVKIRQARTLYVQRPRQRFQPGGQCL